MKPGEKKISQKEIKFKKRSKIVLDFIRTKPRITNKQLAKILGMDIKDIKILIKEMVNRNLISIKSTYKRVNDNKQILKIRNMKAIKNINPVGPENNTEIGLIENELKQEEIIIYGDNPVGPENNTETGPVFLLEEEERSLDNKDKETIFSFQGINTKDKQFTNSIRQKAIDLDPTILLNKNGEETCVVFGKGFSKYDETLYEL